MSVEYADLAREVWIDEAPHEVDAMSDPEGFFARVGAEVQQLVDDEVRRMVRAFPDDLHPQEREDRAAFLRELVEENVIDTHVRAVAMRVSTFQERDHLADLRMQLPGIDSLVEHLQRIHFNIVDDAEMRGEEAIPSDCDRAEQDLLLDVYLAVDFDPDALPSAEIPARKAMLRKALVLCGYVRPEQ